MATRSLAPDGQESRGHRSGSPRTRRWPSSWSSGDGPSPWSSRRTGSARACSTSAWALAMDWFAQKGVNIITEAKNIKVTGSAPRPMKTRMASRTRSRPTASCRRPAPAERQAVQGARGQGAGAVSDRRRQGVGHDRPRRPVRLSHGEGEKTPTRSRRTLQDMRGGARPHGRAPRHPLPRSLTPTIHVVPTGGNPWPIKSVTKSC